MDRGVLIPYGGTGTQRLATTYHFDEAGLEAAIARTIAMSDAECAQLGASGRAWFLDNKRGFRPAVSRLRSPSCRCSMKLPPRQ